MLTLTGNDPIRKSFDLFKARNTVPEMCARICWGAFSAAWNEQQRKIDILESKLSQAKEKQAMAKYKITPNHANGRQPANKPPIFFEAPAGLSKADALAVYNALVPAGLRLNAFYIHIKEEV